MVQFRSEQWFNINRNKWFSLYRNNHVDTRMKLEIKYNNDSIETICMDRFIINRNNQLLVNTDSLKYLLTWTE